MVWTRTRFNENFRNIFYDGLSMVCGFTVTGEMVKHVLETYPAAKELVMMRIEPDLNGGVNTPTFCGGEFANFYTLVTLLRVEENL